MTQRSFPAGVLATSLWLVTAAAMGQSVSVSRTVPGRTQASTDVALDARNAQAWALTPEEWTRYRRVMQGPLGLLSPGLDPLTALGIEARSAAERRHYAEVQVRFEAQRVQRELAYQQAYDAAWKRLYPQLQRVNLAAAAGPTPTRTDDAGGRLAVFVKANCPACDARVQQLQAAGDVFDVYVVGSRGEDANVRAWATHAGIDPAKVRARTITLNHDGGRWLSIGGQGDLPAIVQEIDGSWQRR